MSAPALEIDVDIDGIDAHLCLGMAEAGVPRALPHSRIMDMGERQAAPVPSRRQTRGAFTGELIGECLLLPIRVTKHMRAELTVSLLIGAGDLLATEDRLAEQLVG